MLNNNQPQVDFYILPHTDFEQDLLFVCRLTSKAYTLGNLVYINTPSLSAAQSLDSLLWSYRKNSFLPHSLIDDLLPPTPPILIGYSCEIENDFEKILLRMYTLVATTNNISPWETASAPGLLLINLAAHVPTFFNKFTRVAEIVDQNEQNIKYGRARFIYYRNNGINPENYKL